MNKHTRQAKGPDGTLGFRRVRGMGPPVSNSTSTLPTTTSQMSRIVFNSRKKEKTMDEALNQALTRELQLLRRDNDRLRIENDELCRNQRQISKDKSMNTQWHVEAVKSLTEKLEETAELLSAEKQRSERLEAEVIRLKRILERFTHQQQQQQQQQQQCRTVRTPTSASPTSSPTLYMDEDAIEEAESLSSIYGEGFMRYSDGSYRITIPVAKTSRSSAMWSLLCRPTRGYPSSAPMQFSIESSGPHNIHPNELNRVKKELWSQFCPGEVAVFGWVEHLKSALNGLVNTPRGVAW